jgi:hypothetical protein
MTDATSGAEIAYPPRAPEFAPPPSSVFNGVCVTLSLVLCVCFVDRCLFFCPFSFGQLSVLRRSTNSDYPFGIFKFFLYEV